LSDEDEAVLIVKVLTTLCSRARPREKGVVPLAARQMLYLFLKNKLQKSSQQKEIGEARKSGVCNYEMR